MAGHKVTHVKAHGSLGNLTNDEDGFAYALGKAVRKVDPKLVLVTMPGRNTEKVAAELKLTPAAEFFADRTYDDMGQLTSRKIAGSVIHDAAAAAERVVRTLAEGAVLTTGGRKFPMKADTICVHSDTPAAVKMAEAVRVRLEKEGWTIKPFAKA